MKLLCCLLLIACLYGCNNQYTIVKEGPLTIKSITVTPAKGWNKVPSAFSFGGVPTWTRDGAGLNSLSFFSEIKNDQPLIKSTGKERYPVFRADMLPTEIVELVESTIVKSQSANILNSGELKPASIDGNPGFEYVFEYVGADELPRRIYAVAAVKGEQLHLILYQAARLHYYDSSADEVKSLIATAAIK